MSMKKYKITWSPKAHNDLQNIHFYIKYYLKEKTTANNVVKKLLNSISNLSYSPEKYIKIQYFDNKKKNIRKMLVDNYLVIYEVNNKFEQVFILHIFHCSQNYFNLL